MAVGYSLLIGSVTSQIINSWPNRKLLNYSYIEQLKDILPGILLAVFMGECVYWFKYLPINKVLILIVQFFVGAGIYIGGSAIFKLESFEYIYNILLKRIYKKNKSR